MKMLIVDDEKHVRNTIRLLIDWNSFHVEKLLEAEDVSEAIAIIEREHPQLIITDIMMPFNNGFDLMEWIDAYAKSCKKIVISGYNDFEYVRNTVKCGATDYLLKPIVREQLQDAVQKAIDSWNEEERTRLQNHSLNIKVNELTSIYTDKLISNLIISPFSYSNEINLLINNFPELKNASTIRVALLNFEYIKSDIREKYSSNMSLLVFSLINICNEFLHITKIGSAFQNFNNSFEIGLLLWNELDDMEQVIGKINLEIAKTLNACFDIGISSKMPFPNKIQEAYKQAQKALRQRNLLDTSTCIHFFQTEVMVQVRTLSFDNYKEMMSLAMKCGRPDQLQASIQNWFVIIKKMDKISIEQLQLLQDELKLLEAHWVEEFPQQSEAELQHLSEFNLPIDVNGHFSVNLFQQELTHYLMELMSILVPQKGIGYSMSDIAKYIELNYNKNITLQEISNHYYLSRGYISRKFKQDLHENVFDYLNRVRINKSKILLMNSQIKIADVAEMVGFQDEKYFSRVFKKLEYQTPKEFRKQVNSET